MPLAGTSDVADTLDEGVPQYLKNSVTRATARVAPYGKGEKHLFDATRHIFSTRREGKILDHTFLMRDVVFKFITKML